MPKHFLTDPPKVPRFAIEKVQEFVGSMDMEWLPALHKAGIQGYFSTGGSFACNHVAGAKPSRNPEQEEDGRCFLEVDHRYNLWDMNVNPQGKDLQRVIEEVTGLKFVKNYFKKRWNIPIPHSVFYGYFNVPGMEGLGELELELCVWHDELVVDIAQYWQDIFSRDEIDWQRWCRAILRKAGLKYEIVRELKEWQCAVSRWRILAAFAQGRLAHKMHKIIRPFLLKWWDYPLDKIPDFGVDLPESPEPPNWVILAQREAKKRRLEEFTPITPESTIVLPELFVPEPTVSKEMRLS
jgi:hypothetical protein